jgi:cell division protein ZapA
MAQLTITVNGRAYDLACENGEEERLLSLARAVDRQVGALAARSGPVDETRLMLMASLVLADRLDDALGELEALRRKPPTALPPGFSESELVADLEALADRIEEIAARLEPT